MDHAKSKFPKIKGRVLLNEPLSGHTTFRIGGACRFWVEPDSDDELKTVLEFAAAERKKIFLVGSGSNILFKDKAFDGVVIHLGSKGFKKISIDGTEVIAGAGVNLARMINLTCEKGLKGIEGLAGIPGTVGGAVFMNAGYMGNVSDYLREVKVMRKDNGKIERIARKKLKFAYRHSNLKKYIILEATLRLKKDNKVKLMKKRNELLRSKREKQPLGSFSAGCVFKNPDNGDFAARYIDALGFKGERIGDAEVSEKHANFIVNVNKAKARDVLRLINLIKKSVKESFGADLETEIIIA